MSKFLKSEIKKKGRGVLVLLISHVLLLLIVPSEQTVTPSFFPWIYVGIYVYTIDLLPHEVEGAGEISLASNLAGQCAGNMVLHG